MVHPLMQRIHHSCGLMINAEEAVRFYASVFKNSKINKITHSPEKSANQIVIASMTIAKGLAAIQIGGRIGHFAVLQTALSG